MPRKKTSQTVTPKVTTTEAKYKMPFPKVPGFAFAWLDVIFRNEHGWGIWRPVERDSSLGEKVQDFMVNVERKYLGTTGKTNSNYFYKSAKTILAFAPEKDREAALQRAQERADAPLEIIEQSQDKTVEELRIGRRLITQPKPKI